MPRYRVDVRRKWDDVGLELVASLAIEADGPYLAARRVLQMYEPEPLTGKDAPLLINVVSLL